MEAALEEEEVACDTTTDRTVTPAANSAENVARAIYCGDPRHQSKTFCVLRPTTQMGPLSPTTTTKKKDE